MKKFNVNLWNLSKIALMYAHSQGWVDFQRGETKGSIRFDAAEEGAKKAADVRLTVADSSMLVLCELYDADASDLL